ncbi:hypothetical protein DENSPDRAFT_874868 [Dentipellis sp. KUC8613]|nr:hypothetical protein DENSPDRAFT_874868 [Dentipellis sp. KUC8613]
MPSPATIANASSGRKRARDDADDEPQQAIVSPGSERGLNAAPQPPRQQKRPRTNAATQTSPPRATAAAFAMRAPTAADRLPIKDCQRREEFWFDDGDVVVRAEDQLFKLNKGKMSVACNFFRSMFEDGHIGVGSSGPDGQNDDDHYEGMPLIHGAHTSLREWELLIYVIYKIKENLLVVSWDDIRTMLELSRKYESLPMRELAIRNMSFLYPTTLPDFMMSTFLRKKYIDGALPNSVHFQAYNLAIEFDLYQFLPAISYRLTQYEFGNIISGVRETPDAEPIRLPAGVPASILEAREGLRELRSQLLFKFMQEPWRSEKPCGPSGNKCQYKRPPAGPSCEQVIARLRCDWHRDGHILRNTLHPLKTLTPSSHTMLRDLLCAPCRFAMKEEMSRGQAKMWVGMPEMFDLGTWFDIERKVRAKRVELAQLWSPDGEMLS